MARGKTGQEGGRRDHSLGEAAPGEGGAGRRMGESGVHNGPRIKLGLNSRIKLGLNSNCLSKIIIPLARDRSVHKQIKNM